MVKRFKACCFKLELRNAVLVKSGGGGVEGFFGHCMRSVPTHILGILDSYYRTYHNNHTSPLYWRSVYICGQVNMRPVFGWQDLILNGPLCHEINMNRVRGIPTIAVNFFGHQNIIKGINRSNVHSMVLPGNLLKLNM